ncbi:MAG: uroporphyrinogen decarboxylase family protein [Chloroflexota bacterium]
MSPLTPRERVLAVLDHHKPDRVPLAIGADLTTGIQEFAYRRLAAHLNIDAEYQPMYDWHELGAPNPAEAVLRRLRSDVRGIHDRFPAATYERNRSRPAGSPYVDDWGVGQLEIEPGIFFPAIHPLQSANRLEDIQAHLWPDMRDPARYAHLYAEAGRLAEENQYAIVGAPWLLSPLERAFQLQGMQAFLLNLVDAPDFAAALLRQITDLCLQNLEHFLHATGDRLDILILADDLGTQTSLLISPRAYRSLLKPLHAELIARARELCRARVMFHSDGDVFPLLDDLVEIGVDILNPVQITGCMADLAQLKQRYGRQLVFCGGIDTQRVLPLGSPAEVRAEVKRVIETLGADGGYLLAAVHTIPNETPPENILAMVDAALEFGCF